MQTITADTEGATTIIKDVREKINIYSNQGNIVGNVLEYLKLPPLNMNIIHDATEMVNGLDFLWRAIAEWRVAT